MAQDSLEFIQRETGPDPQHVIIWLHGLGADGHDFEPIVPELGLNIPVRFIFPHAPMQPVTVNGGMVMRAWYDIVGMDIGADIDELGINQSAKQVRELIQQQIEQGISSERIMLAGFSQGGVIALHTGLLYPQKLSGIVALSTYLAIPAAIERSASEANKDIEIFMGHGLYDPIVPYPLGKQGESFLSRRGYSIQWQEYPMEHSVHPDEIRHVGNWLNQILSK